MRMLAKARKSPDYVLFGAVLALTVFGIVMLSSASSDLATRRFGDSSYYVVHQILFGLVPGAVGFALGFFVPYRWLAKAATPLLILSIVLLILVFTPLGLHAKGGDRWLSIGEFSFQPSELLKLTFFIYLAAWISRTAARSKSFTKGFLPFLVLVGGVMLFLLAQPATTVAMIIFLASVLMYFAGGAKIKFLAVAALVACLAISVIIYLSPNQYRLERIMTFLNQEEADPEGAGYHITQAKMAIGAGSIAGVGFGQSATKVYFLPEPIGDSIFAVIAEELGFLGSMVVLGGFFLIVWRGLSIARKVGDSFGRYLVIGFTCVLGLQAFVNIAAISGLMPLTGVPLPFISYGGTALAVFLTMSGIMVQVSRYRSEKYAS